MDVGVRPGKIIGLTLPELHALADSRAPARRVGTPALENDVVAMLKTHEPSRLQHAFTQWLMRQGLQRFVLETIAPLNRVVGDAWMRGELFVFEEHLYTELLKAALRTAINAFPRQGGSPCLLLTTLPNEQHGLGLLMVEALLAPEGALCISLGPQTPLEDVRRAAIAHKADIVALSFSAAFPVRQATDALASLRRHLPASIAVWAGGDMTRRIRKTLPGVTLLPELPAAIGALRSWRAQHVQSA
jgi:methanogenic corrinoid protein MtbC1